MSIDCLLRDYTEGKPELRRNAAEMHRKSAHRRSLGMILGTIQGLNPIVPRFRVIRLYATSDDPLELVIALRLKPFVGRLVRLAGTKLAQSFREQQLRNLGTVIVRVKGVHGTFGPKRAGASEIKLVDVLFRERQGLAEQDVVAGDLDHAQPAGPH